MKKMMFNDRYGLTEAVLQGRKMVIRRLVKPTKPRSLANCLQGVKYECMVDENDNQYEAPYYVGEIVAVAQRYSSLVPYSSDRYYPELMEAINEAHCLCCEHTGHLETVAAWTNKMFVKADLMPHQIRILDVRAERLQDITDEDCLREGISEERPEFYDLPTGSEKIYFHYHNFNPDAPDYNTFGSAKEAFATLINKISSKGTWERNPYVWRIEFELIK